MYPTQYTSDDINQLWVGLHRHLLIAQDTTQKKTVRAQSLDNIATVVEFVLETLSDQRHSDMMEKFLHHLLKKVKIARVSIDHKPENFDPEIGFIVVLKQLT